MRTSWYPQVEMEHQHGKIQFFFYNNFEKYSCHAVDLQIQYMTGMCLSYMKTTSWWHFFNLYLLDSRKGPYITRNKVTISIEKAEIGKFTVSILYIHRSSDY